MRTDKKKINLNRSFYASTSVFFPSPSYQYQVISVLKIIIFYTLNDKPPWQFFTVKSK